MICLSNPCNNVYLMLPKYTLACKSVYLTLCKYILARVITKNQASRPLQDCLSFIVHIHPSMSVYLILPQYTLARVFTLYCLITPLQEFLPYFLPVKPCKCLHYIASVHPCKSVYLILPKSTCLGHPPNSFPVLEFLTLSPYSDIPEDLTHNRNMGTEVLLYIPNIIGEYQLVL